MRILWICNIMLPVVAEYLQLESSHKEGWLSGLSGRVMAHSGETDILLGVAFPAAEPFAKWQATIPVEQQGKEPASLMAYGFPEDLSRAEIYQQNTEERIKEIIEEFEPDILHCFGTEYPHTLAAVRAFQKPRRTLIGIQGLCGVYAEHFRADLPERVWNSQSLRDLLKGDNLRQQKRKFQLRGQHEMEAIQAAGHITGRTQWDRYYTHLWNEKATYHFMNETLRANFYEGIWDLARCRKHSIFLSQGDYPIKGLHYLIKALPEIIREYPDTQVYVAGNSIIKTATQKGLKGVIGKCKLEAYGNYILKLMKQTDTISRIHFLGKLGPQEMKQQYLLSHVFLCPSSIENSPNSVGEAMLLGVPTVCARVGGIPSIFYGEDHEKPDGILYKVDDSKALAEAVCRMFEGEVANRFTINARQHARRNHDGETNYFRLLEIYREINQKNQ